MINKTYNVILCQTKNQVNDIRLIFENLIEKESIPLPTISTLNDWLVEQYQEFCMAAAPINESQVILSGIEESMLWKVIIDEDLNKRDYSLLDTDSIVQEALSADQIIKNYQISMDELKEASLSKESTFLYEWLKEFNKYCSKKRVLSRLSFIELFIKQQKEYKVVSENNILFAGFDNNTPLYEKLLKVLREANQISHFKKEDIKQNRQEKSYAKPDLEMLGVTQWVKTKVAEGARKLLIISPVLSKVQINLQNKINREVNPEIFKNLSKESIYDSDLQRPLTSEPIIRAGLQLLELTQQAQMIKPKIIYECLLFNNWIDNRFYAEREKLGNYLKLKNNPSYSIHSIQHIIDNDPKLKDLELDSLKDTLKILKKYRKLWSKSLRLREWVYQIEALWNEIKFSEINFLLSFEINNLNSLYASLHQLKNNEVVDGLIEFKTFMKLLFIHLESWPAPKKDGQSLIDIKGFYENPIKEYDAIWLMNMNDNHWPGKLMFNSLLPMKLQKKYHIFDEEYYKKINTFHQDRLKKFGPNLTVSFSQTDEDGNPLFCSNNYFSDIKEGLITKKRIEGKKSLNHVDFILDNYAPEVTGEKKISRGTACLENFQKCPAWAFYENRLGAFKSQEDEVEELSPMARGTIAHELLEDFWRKYKNSEVLKSMSDEQIKNNITQIIEGKLKTLEASLPFLSPFQIKVQSNYFNRLLFNWLSYEKNHRGIFKVSSTEKAFTANIGRLSFKLKIDRVDEYTDGSMIVIDYKTGSTTPNLSDYQGTIKSLQLPLYAAYSEIKNLSAIGIAKVSINDQKIYGLTSHIQLPPDGDLVLSKKISWEHLLPSWQEQIFNAASGFLKGDASITFTDQKDLDYCSVKSILRLGDKKRQFEEEEDGK